MASVHLSERDYADLKVALAIYRREADPTPVGLRVLSVIAWTSAGITLTVLLIRLAISLAT